MRDIEQRLLSLGADVVFPPTPEISDTVALRLRATPVPSSRRRPHRRTLAIALAALAVPAAALAGDDLLRRLGLAHIAIRHLERIPTLRAPLPLDLGEPLTDVDDASHRAHFTIRVPMALGKPDAVYVDRTGVVSLAYAPRPGLRRDRYTGLGVLVTELQALPEPEVLTKSIGPGTRLEAVRVNGVRGVFLSGAPHAVTVLPTQEEARQLEPRLAGTTLAFEDGTLVVRIEGRLTKRQALRIARSTAR